MPSQKTFKWIYIVSRTKIEESRTCEVTLEWYYSDIENTWKVVIFHEILRNPETY